MFYYFVKDKSDLDNRTEIEVPGNCLNLCFLWLSVHLYFLLFDLFFLIKYVIHDVIFGEKRIHMITF